MQQGNELHKLQAELESATQALDTASKSLEETRAECDRKADDVRQVAPQKSGSRSLLIVTYRCLSFLAAGGAAKEP